MQFTTSLIALLAAASTSLAAPGRRDVKNMMASGQWTIEAFTRGCNDANDSCDYRFGINTNDGSASTPCSYTVTGSPASQAGYQGVVCGAFTIGSSWSGQFGPGNGFQTLSVVRDGQIIYPAYSDSQIQNNVAVTPDQSYTPQALP